MTASLPKRQLVSLMLGRDLIAPTEEARSSTSADERSSGAYMQTQGLGRKGMIEPLDLSVAQGEIVGLTGLLGSGRTESAKLIFGIDRSDKGQILVKGHKVTINSPRQAVSHGFAMCPEDRKVEGIIPELSVRENIILALQSKQGWLTTLSRKKQEEIAQEMISALHIVTPNAEKPVGQLSGGNQQKVILARWLASQPKLLILDEPTRGIDVGAHAEIVQIIKHLCSEGMALLVISSELAEIVEYSNRVVVLRDRKKLTELTGDDITEQKIMHAIAEA